MSIYYATMDSPVGRLVLSATKRGLRSLDFEKGTECARADPGWISDEALLAGAVGQLRAYFAGTLREFDLDLDLEGTPFQRLVWMELQRIPCGTTISYGELARRIGKPKASRAVGGANGANPIPIVIPCHRVIAASGHLGGFSSGLRIKRKLLAHEGVAVEDAG